MAEKLLIEVNDSVQLYLYEGILKQNKIPYMIKRPNVRSYMHILTGAAHAVPAEIYVPEEIYDSAIDITEVIRTEKSQAPDNKNNPAYKSRKFFAWIFIGAIAVSILVVVLSEFVFR